MGVDSQLHRKTVMKGCWCSVYRNIGHPESQQHASLANMRPLTAPIT
jgi:hypothetical protein